MSSPSAARSAVSAGKAPAKGPPPDKGRSMTQVSMAQLLGLREQEASNVSLRLNMSSGAGSSSSAAPAPAPARDPAAEVTLAAHERPRAQKRKAPEGPRGRAKAARMTAESKLIKRDSRLVEFPDQGLKISAGVLFCQPCKTTLPNIRNSIASHLMTNKHKANLIKFANQQLVDCTLRSELSEYFEANPDEKTVSTHALHTTHVILNPSTRVSCDVVCARHH